MHENTKIGSVGKANIAHAAISPYIRSHPSFTAKMATENTPTPPPTEQPTPRTPETEALPVPKQKPIKPERPIKDPGTHRGI
jgi:hypothetical protein